MSTRPNDGAFQARYLGLVGRLRCIGGSGDEAVEDRPLLCSALLYLPLIWQVPCRQAGLRTIVALSRPGYYKQSRPKGNPK
jgi:hypothetical protein